MITAADYHNTYNTHPEIHAEVDVIITGTTWMTPEDVDLESVSCPVMFNPESTTSPTLTSIVTHKAHVINTAKVDRFYENQQEQASLLKILCPDCRIILLAD